MIGFVRNGPRRENHRIQEAAAYQTHQERHFNLMAHPRFKRPYQQVRQRGDNDGNTGKSKGEPRIAERVAVQGMDHHDRNDGDQNHIDPVPVQNLEKSLLHNLFGGSDPHLSCRSNHSADEQNHSHCRASRMYKCKTSTNEEQKSFSKQNRMCVLACQKAKKASQVLALHSIRRIELLQFTVGIDLDDIVERALTDAHLIAL